MKKKLLNIVGDNKGWAIPNRAKNLAVYLKQYFEITDYFKWDLPTNFNDYDLIHMHHPVLNNKFLRIKTKWGMELPGPTTLSKVKQLGLLKKADFVVAKNESLFESVKNETKNHLCLITNGVDQKIFKPKVYRVGWVGNDVGESGQKAKRTNLIREACSTFNEDLKEVLEVIFVKDPSEYPKNIQTPEQISEFYNTLDMFILSSDPSKEGSSNVVLEALASGLPVITTKVGNWKYLQKLCPKDILIVDGTVSSIKNGILKILEKNIHRRKTVLQHLTWEKIAEQYVELYKKIGII